MHPTSSASAFTPTSTASGLSPGDALHSPVLAKPGSAPSVLPPSREKRLAALAKETFDLVIVGGGITGAGIARDAALRGLRVALVEKGDFASGTSSKSSRLIHGGLRYLEQAQLGLVFEATAERALLLKRASHLVEPLEFLIPAFRPGFLAKVWAGLWLYDLLALFRKPAGHRRYAATGVSTLEPGLRREGLVGGLTYRDCATNDSRLVVENMLDAITLGACCVSYVRATGVLRRGKSGRIDGISVRCERTGERVDVRARLVVVAGGPWTESVLASLEARPAGHVLRPTKGVHIIVPAERLPLSRAVTMATRDHRIVFAIPSGVCTVIGTTDTDTTENGDVVAATFEDVIYLLGTTNFYFPDAKLRLDDVRSTYAGLRPLIAAAGSASNVPREHEILRLPGGILAIAGGKLTTYRRMAKEVVDLAVVRLHDKGFAEGVRSCETHVRPLPRCLAAGTTIEAEAARLEASHEVDADIALHLVRTYGRDASKLLEADVFGATRLYPGLPYLRQELLFALRNDLAETVDDVLWRRVPLGLFAPDQGLAVGRDVVTAARALGRAPGPYDAERFASSVEATRQFRNADSERRSTWAQE